MFVLILILLYLCWS